jgi:hypothetical protein
MSVDGALGSIDGFLGSALAAQGRQREFLTHADAFESSVRFKAALDHLVAEDDVGLVKGPSVN